MVGSLFSQHMRERESPKTHSHRHKERERENEKKKPIQAVRERDYEQTVTGYSR